VTAIAVLAGCGGAARTVQQTHVAPSPHFGAPTNAIANGSFELGTAHWSTYPNSTLRISRGRARFGARSIVVQTLTSNRYGVFQVGVVGLPTHGSRWTLSGWVRGLGTTVGQRAIAQVNEAGGAAPAAAIATVSGVLQKRWTHLTASGTVRGRDRTSLDVYFFRTTNIIPRESFLVDGVQLRFTPR
jgi:hypothetical protein